MNLNLATTGSQHVTRNPEPATRNPLHETCLCVELPVIDYQKARDLQSYLVSARKDNIIDSDMVIILEHPPVFTLGRRGGLENLSVSESFLKKLKIPLIHVERGGNITFHGPGQIVVYPIINLGKARLAVTDFVSNLEEVMIQTAKDLGVQARRNGINRGIWVGEKKLGSIGIAVRKGISFHGMALNVNLSLEPFNWINPCGLQNIKMTSIQQELSHSVSLSHIRRTLKQHFESIFGIKLVATDIKELCRNFNLSSMLEFKSVKKEHNVF
ncbi:MAG: lipoyl(octanoyl) transferase LipB [Thermodesulfobacteriota bacterium]|nr:lipoyl(octanoyl) transferase LipB [Thermodesulfobacteriota bacterium]